MSVNLRCPETMKLNEPATSITPLSLIVKATTAVEHQRLEAVVPLMSPSIDLNTYSKYLQMLWWLYFRIETATLAACPDWFEAMSLRRRVPLIEDDLSSLGFFKETIDVPSGPVPSVATFEQRLGVYYVLEGSSLGGKVIYKHLLDRGIVNDTHSAKVFDPYGRSTMARWQSFRTVIDAHSDNSSAAATIIGSARDTFCCFTEWVQQAFPTLPHQ